MGRFRQSSMSHHLKCAFFFCLGKHLPVLCKFISRSCKCLLSLSWVCASTQCLKLNNRRLLNWFFFSVFVHNKQEHTIPSKYWTVMEAFLNPLKLSYPYFYQITRPLTDRTEAPQKRDYVNAFCDGTLLDSFDFQSNML